jgi:hypothetical protein
MLCTQHCEPSHRGSGEWRRSGPQAARLRVRPRSQPGQVFGSLFIKSQSAPAPVACLSACRSECRRRLTVLSPRVSARLDLHGTAVTTRTVGHPRARSYCPRVGPADGRLRPRGRDLRFKDADSGDTDTHTVSVKAECRVITINVDSDVRHVMGYCSRDFVKASVEGGAAPAELEQNPYHRFHPPPLRLWEGVVVVISSWC